MSHTFLNRLENKIIHDLTKDKSLASDFESDPKKVLQEKYNLSAPEGLNIKVHRDTADTINIVLPHEDDEHVGIW